MRKTVEIGNIFDWETILLLLSFPWLSLTLKRESNFKILNREGVRSLQNLIKFELFKKNNICSPTSLFYIIQSNVPYISCRVSHELCNYFIFNYTDDKMKTYLQCSPTKKKRNIIYCFHQLRKNNSACKYLS